MSIDVLFGYEFPRRGFVQAYVFVTYLLILVSPYIKKGTTVAVEQPNGVSLLTSLVRIFVDDEAREDDCAGWDLYAINQTYVLELFVCLLFEISLHNLSLEPNNIKAFFLISTTLKSSSTPVVKSKMYNMF